MSPVYLIAGLIILLTALACYVFISQHLTKKRKQQQRVLNALQKRQQLFKHLIAGFPPGYLTTELNQYVYRSMLSNCEQLAKLAPKEDYDQQFQLYSKQLEAQQASKAGKTKLTPEQLNQVRPLLQELQRYIASQAEKNRLAPPQAATYSQQIRRLMLQSTIESYSQQAKQALNDQKPRLAIHYYTLARKLLLKEASRQNVKKQVEQLSAIINKLEAQQPELAGGTAAEAEDEEQTRKQWEAFEESEDWKKKQIYD